MIEQLNASLALIISQTQANAHYLMRLLAVLWILFFMSNLTGKRLLLLGIHPRKWWGLPGIIFSPLLHANFNHLFFNSIPLVVLSNFILIHGLPYFWHVTISITLISGTLVWCFAKPGCHVGASSVITGYWALLVSDIYQQGTVTAIILGVISLYYFSGIFLGIFPSSKGISWEGHLFGLIAGVITGLYVVT